MADRMGRRSFLTRSAAAAAGVAGVGAVGDGLLSGIAGGSPPPPGRTNGSGRNGISNAKPRHGGSLTFGADAEEQGFDPTTAEWDEVGYMYGRTVFDPLTTVTTTGQVVPYLAESVVPNGDFTSWTITMRPGINFTDGTPCDGNALRVNLEKQQSSILTGAVFSQLVKDISQTGPMSVRLDMSSAWATFPYYTSSASQVGYIAAPSMLNNPNGTKQPVGTGPFIFETWVPNDHFTAKRNPNYWRKGYPYLDQITFKPIADDNARAQALQSGTVDIMHTVTPQTVLEFRGNRQWSYVDDSLAVVGEPSVNCIQLNGGAPPFNNHNARLAVAKSYDQAAFVKAITENVSTPVTSPFVPDTPYYAPASYPGYDPAGARRAVQAYQHQTGKSLSFTLTYIPDPQVQRAALYLQQKYEAVGMKVQLSVVEQNTLISNAVAGKYQAVTWRQFGTVDPDLNYVFWSANTVKQTGISLNIARNNDPRIQSALETGRSTLNLSVRSRAYKSIGEYLAQDLPYTWLGRAVWAVAATPKVQNFNNPIAPNGSKVIGFTGGTIWPTQVWLS